MVGPVECIPFFDVGALVKKAVANERFSLFDEEQGLVRADRIVLNLTDHRCPSARGSEHDF